MTGVPFRVKAVYEYSSPHEDDLSFPEGTIITVTDEEDADWYSGEYVDDAGVKQEGLFPRNFVEKFEPQAPPRPTRTRTKKESEPAPESAPAPEPEAQPESPPGPQAVPQQEPTSPQRAQVEHDTADVTEPPSATIPAAPAAVQPAEPEPSPAPAPASAPAPVTAPVQQAPAPEPAPVASPEPAPAPAPAPAAAKPAPTQSKPSGPPPVSSKPSSNAFKDRIAAFNKPAAAPVTPFKPSGLGGSGTGFIKKPFVAPPPSRHAYVPTQKAPTPQRVYRRDEDPEVKEQEALAQENAEKAGFGGPSAGAAADPEEGDEDQPKPTSLKERIALLQKQQMEQAQRHADAANKKEKPKRPVKKRTESHETTESVAEEGTEAGAPPTPFAPPVPEAIEPEEPVSKKSLDSDRMPPPPRRKSSKGPSVPEPYHDGNEADMSGAGDTTEGQEDLNERDSDERPRPPPRVPTGGVPEPRKSAERPRPVEEASVEEEEEEEEADEEEDVDPEVRRKQELRERMMKLSGAGPGMINPFGGPAPSAPPKKKRSSEPRREERVEEEDIPRAAPPVPVPGMMLPGMGAPPPPPRAAEESSDVDEPVPVKSPTSPRVPPPPPVHPANDDADESSDSEPAPSRSYAEPSAAPPVPGGRPAPPPVPSASRPVPPPPPADAPESAGSESDDDTSGAVAEDLGPAQRSAPPLPPASTRAPPPVPAAGGDDEPPMSPTEGGPSKRNSRPPPPIPGTAPALPPAPPGQGRPPPPPPPGGGLSRQSTQDFAAAAPITSPTNTRRAGDEEEEVTEYEGDYDTDIAPLEHHKDALKAHARDSSLEDASSLKSPTTAAPPLPSSPPAVPTASVPKAVPPPIPTQAPQSPPMNDRRSVDMPRAAPPPPPPSAPAPAPRETPSQGDDEYDPFNYSAPKPGGFGPRTPKIEEEATFESPPDLPSPPPQSRAPPPPPGQGINRAATRQSLDLPRHSSTIRRSMDAHRPSMESGFIANDVDLAAQSGWWRQPNQVPPIFQGRRDLLFESDETTSTNQGTKTVVTRNVYVLFQDYSQTIITATFDPYSQNDVELDQRHEPPPRALRQDQLEQSYERFGRAIASAVASKKDSVVADGTPHGLVYELLRPFADALAPVGTRAYGALVYSNLANASTQQNDEIRAGDIVSIRNARFQGKHGPMHAKYSAEVGKPDHVGVVAEWDGTKKKIRAWEQGRENKKVKVESFKLDDLRSGEVKVWRVMPRSWVGWSSQP